MKSFPFRELWRFLWYQNDQAIEQTGNVAGYFKRLNDYETLLLWNRTPFPHGRQEPFSFWLCGEQFPIRCLVTQSCELKFVFTTFRSRYLTGVSLTLLPMCVFHFFKKIIETINHASEDLTRSYYKAFSRISTLGRVLNNVHRTNPYANHCTNCTPSYLHILKCWHRLANPTLKFRSWLFSCVPIFLWYSIACTFWLGHI